MTNKFEEVYLWYYDAKRLYIELEQLKYLESCEKSLNIIRWKKNKDQTLSILGKVIVNEKDHNFELIFPQYYPAECPIIFPIPRGESWSGHQYLGSGALCLEWGPDNWEPKLNAANVIKSLINLLFGEAPREVEGLNKKGTVESRHSTTQGIDLRNEINRIILTDNLIEIMESLASNGKLTVHSLISEETWINYIIEINDSKEISEDIPKSIFNSRFCSIELKGYWFKTNKEFSMVSGLLNSIDMLNMVLKLSSFDIIIGDSIGFRYDDIKIKIPLLILTKDKKIITVFLSKGEDGKIICKEITPITTDFNLSKSRVPSEIYTKIQGKSVAIIGAGSLGSKLSRSLASTGLNTMILVDDDILLPENISRHIAGFNNIGEHKVILAKESAEAVLIKSNIEAIIHQVGEQTNTSVHTKLISKIASNTLIIDCSANSRSFQILGMISSKLKIPMVWGEVFPGGLGGWVAYAIPNITPCPFCVRRAILEEFRQYPDLPGIAINNYGILPFDGSMAYEALDADVSYIASVMVHRVIAILSDDDSLSENHPFIIYSLRKGWIFENAYEVIRVPVRIDDFNCGLCWSPFLSDGQLPKAKKTKIDKFLANIKIDGEN